ncbi:Transcriptional regulator in cluster with unspecified monosaccharide ABC transport system [Lactococcus garvieae DCC43]|uniref:Transcriptional regulator in cluster with unspecified monosaccharide ABC transport system n=1 Tax=Lactococcus garvieae DCC43 TaxID=1231377 RepID=K2PM25_9LACT|nr:Transcriptional regulator in cluster with unspecified monosaccharide ABC transport system [Lactococcus garvieae DCC43]
MAIKTIGEVLKEKRTDLGLGLSEAEKLTNIPKLYIIALETGDYKALPGDFYIKAYLKQYAEKLELDADQILLAYEKDGSMTVEDYEDIQETYRFVKPSERVEESEEEEEVDVPAWRHYVPIILLSAVALAIVGGVTAVVLLSRPQSNDLEDASYNYKTSETVKSTEQKKTSESKEKPVESKPAPENQLTVTGSGAQLNVKVDNASSPTKIVFTTAAGTVTTISLTNADWATVRTLSDAENTATATLGAGLTNSVINLSNTQGLTMTINGSNVDLSALTVGSAVSVQLTVAYASTTE